MRDDKASMMLVLSKDDKKLLKKLAVDLDTTASALVSQWLHEHLEGCAGGSQGTEV